MGRARQVGLKNGQGMTKSMSTEILHQYNKQPIHVRSRAEQWELPRTEIELTGKLGEGDGGVIFYAHWRGLDVVAKMLKTDADESVPYTCPLHLRPLSRILPPCVAPPPPHSQSRSNPCSGIVPHSKGRKSRARTGCWRSHVAKPVHLIITMIQWIRTIRLSIKNSLCWR